MERNELLQSSFELHALDALAVTTAAAAGNEVICQRAVDTFGLEAGSVWREGRRGAVGGRRGGLDEGVYGRKRSERGRGRVDTAEDGGRAAAVGLVGNGHGRRCNRSLYMSASSGIPASADLLARFAAAAAADPPSVRFLRIRIADGYSPVRCPGTLADPPQMPSSMTTPSPPAAPSQTISLRSRTPRFSTTASPPTSWPV